MRGWGEGTGAGVEGRRRSLVIRGELLDVVDHQEFDRPFLGLEPKAELILQGTLQSGPAGADLGSGILRAGRKAPTSAHLRHRLHHGGRHRPVRYPIHADFVAAFETCGVHHRFIHLHSEKRQHALHRPLGLIVSGAAVGTLRAGAARDRVAVLARDHSMKARGHPAIRGGWV